MAKFIYLTKGMRALVDDEDYNQLVKHYWYLHETKSTSYAARYEYSNGTRKLIYMHRAVLQAKGRHPVDHINRNSLDNRKCNLRQVTISVNNRNRMFR